MCDFKEYYVVYHKSGLNEGEFKEVDTEEEAVALCMEWGEREKRAGRAYNVQAIRRSEINVAMTVGVGRK